MSYEKYIPTGDGEVFRPAFPDVDEAERPYTMVSYGLSFEKACRKHVDDFVKAERVYIICSKSIAAQTDNLQKLETALGEKHAGSWLGVPAHTPYDGLIPILHDVKEKQADCIVTLGGGSLADGAKLLVYAIENGVDTLEDLIKLEKSFIGLKGEVFTGIGKPAKIPLIFIPTTLSGAEYSKFAGCTNPKNDLKVQFTHPTMFAKLVTLDGDLCRSTPSWVWLSTGVRAIDHCVEVTCSTNSRPESDQAAARGLKRLVKSLLVYIRDPDDTRSMLESQLGCNDGLVGLTLMVYCGASHGIGHMLGPLGIGHGQTSCILLPAVLEYNKSVNQSTQDKLKGVLWSQPEIAEVLTKRGLKQEENKLGDMMRAIFNELRMPSSLKEVGIGEDKWDQLAENSLFDKFCEVNPRPLKTKEDVKEILKMCSGD